MDIRDGLEASSANALFESMNHVRQCDDATRYGEGSDTSSGMHVIAERCDKVCIVDRSSSYADALKIARLRAFDMA